MLRTIILITCMVSLTACASTPGKTPPQLQNENNALVQGINQSFAHEILYALPVIDAWTSYTELFFYRIDGTEVTPDSTWGGLPDTIELTPGKHTLAFLCRGKASIQYFHDMVYNYEIEVEAGHKYQMSVELTSEGCGLDYVDITSGQPVEVFSIYQEEELYTVIEPTYWKTRYRKRYSDGYIKEYIPIGESVHDWTRLLTIQFYRYDNRTPLEFVNAFQAKRKEQCPGTQFEVIEEREDSLTYSFNFPACEGQEALSEISRMYAGDAGLHRLSYSEKTTGLTGANKNRYLVLFDNSYVKKPGNSQ